MAARPSPALRAVVGLPTIGLGVLVAAWWLLIAAAVAPLLPSPGARLLPGHRAHIARGMRDWPIPTSRLAFDTFQRGYAAADDAAQAEALARAGWVTVNDGDAVQIVAIDGEVVEIQLLEGGYVGRLAWLKQRQLTPWD
jgi:hypothetical protein